MKLPDFYQADLEAVDAALERWMPAENTPPSSIHRAMRYSVFAGGKRIRPILCMEAARLFTDDIGNAVHVGCALEFIHTYSLIHDDLPSLDNDDLRRGKPTNHKVFGEAIAILAGDALLTLAFQTLASVALDPDRRLRILSSVGTAAGTQGGMIGGQVADLEAERRPVDGAGLEYIHRSKTAALIRASVVAGAIAGGAEQRDITRVENFGEHIGWAFQVVDDLLDVEESSAALGKTAGKDRAQQKATYPALYGLEASRAIAAQLEAKALDELAAYGQRADRLRQVGQFLVARRS
jgi:geranylgeranyl diphosphate synthase, type II